MATVFQPQSDYLSQISGTKPVEDSGVTKTYSGGGSTAAAPSSNTAPTSQQQAAPQNPNAFAAPAGVRPEVTQETYNKLFAPVQQQVQKSRGVLNAAQQGFQQQAGAHRSYEGIGAENTLNQAVEGAPSAFEAARGLVNARYTGPTGLDMNSQEQLAKSGEQLKARMPTLGQRSGVQDLVRGAHRNLSAGELAFESGRLAAAPGFRSQAQGVQSAISNLFANTQGATQAAEQYAQQRAQEEADIANRSRGLLTGREGEISNALDAAVNQARTSDEAKQKAANEFQANATYENLLKLNEQGAGIDPSLFFTPEAAQAKEGEAVKQGIMENERFAKIKDVPTMDLTVNSHGREKLRIPKDWWAENTKGMSKKEKKELKDLAFERQLLLERAGFTPGSAAASNFKSQRQAAAKQAGEYSLYDPLYFDEMGAFQAVDPSTYVGFEPGMEASRESIASPEQRSRYNTILSLLGDEAGQLSAADPYSASAITNEAQRYKEEQTKELEDRRKALEASVKKEQKFVKKARQAHRASGHGISGIVGKINKAIPNAPGNSLLKGGVSMSGGMAGAPLGQKIVKNPKGSGKVG